MNNEEALLVLNAVAILLTDGEIVAKKWCSESEILKAKSIVNYLKTLPSP